MKLKIINGPNLNILGKRQPEIYGYQNFEDYLLVLQETFKGQDIVYFQSNSEGDIINDLQASDGQFDGIIFNGAAYTHTSIAIADTIQAIQTPVIEVHISNIHARETFRHHSYTAPFCKGIISGLGLRGYEFAIAHFILENNQNSL